MLISYYCKVSLLRSLDTKIGSQLRSANLGTTVVFNYVIPLRPIRY